MKNKLQDVVESQLDQMERKWTKKKRVNMIINTQIDKKKHALAADYDRVNFEAQMRFRLH